MSKLEQYRNELLEQQEYETRECYFTTSFDAYDVNFTNDMTYQWKGTQKDYDELIKPYVWMVIKTIKDLEEPSLWRFSERFEAVEDKEEILRRNAFSNIKQKENVRRQAEYKYLKSSY